MTPEVVGAPTSTTPSPRLFEDVGPAGFRYWPEAPDLDVEREPRAEEDLRAARSRHPTLSPERAVGQVQGAPLPPALAMEIRRLLAEALVRDYLDDQRELNSDDGERPLGAANPEEEAE